MRVQGQQAHNVWNTTYLMGKKLLKVMCLDSVPHNRSQGQQIRVVLISNFTTRKNQEKMMSITNPSNRWQYSMLKAATPRARELPTALWHPLKNKISYREEGKESIEYLITLLMKSQLIANPFLNWATIKLIKSKASFLTIKMKWGRLPSQGIANLFWVTNKLIRINMGTCQEKTISTNAFLSVSQHRVQES